MDAPELVHSERFELPALGIEIRCSIQLSYECNAGTIASKLAKASPLPKFPGTGVIITDMSVCKTGNCKLRGRSPVGADN